MELEGLTTAEELIRRVIRKRWGERERKPEKVLGHWIRKGRIRTELISVDPYQNFGSLTPPSPSPGASTIPSAAGAWTWTTVFGSSTSTRRSSHSMPSHKLSRAPTGPTPKGIPPSLFSPPPNHFGQIYANRNDLELKMAEKAANSKWPIGARKQLWNKGK